MKPLSFSLSIAALAAAFMASPALAETVVTPDANPTVAQIKAADRALKGDEHGQPFSAGTADLNEDGRPDLIGHFTGRDFCGSAGCGSFVLLATANGYATHAIDLAYFGEKITLLNTRHHGMHDLRFDDGTHVFKWNGNSYQ